MHRLINPWDYQHVSPCGVLHTAGGVIAATAGAGCFSYDAHGRAPSFWLSGWRPKPTRGRFAAADHAGRRRRAPPICVEPHHAYPGHAVALLLLSRDHLTGQKDGLGLRKGVRRVVRKRAGSA